jgi:hypothetical protein
MGIKYIRKSYNVPAKRGMRVIANGKPGKITGANGSRLRILLDGNCRSLLWHPTWRIEYLDQPPIGYCKQLLMAGSNSAPDIMLAGSVPGMVTGA